MAMTLLLSLGLLSLFLANPVSPLHRVRDLHLNHLDDTLCSFVQHWLPCMQCIHSYDALLVCYALATLRAVLGKAASTNLDWCFASFWYAQCFCTMAWQAVLPT